MRVKTPNYYRDVIVGNNFLRYWSPTGPISGWFQKTQPSPNFIDLIKER